MPGVYPGVMMNGHTDYGRYVAPERGYINGYYDPYSSREDLYREDMRGEDDPYRRPVRNGRPVNDRFNDTLADQNSLSDFNSSEPAFELDHLATFAAGDARKGTMHVEDGLRKLRQMENTTGIWTMRCILLVERRFIVILDKNSGEELERFPVQFVHEPTAIFKNDRREIYNNLILFTVMDESNKRDSQADMHIFQSVRAKAQDIVDEIFAAKRGQARIAGGYKIPPPPMGPAPEPPGARDPYDFNNFREAIEQRPYNQFNAAGYGQSQFNNGGGFFGQRSSMMARPSYHPYREREDEVGSNELLERDVQLLNHCFDDIEKFVARLQQAAEAYKELDRRRKEREGGKGKKNASGDGMLSHRARPPPAQDFVDIFQKFKLSFNLLAKLKAHIHDPNAPELVHFLFTPLSLIFEASRDPIHGNINLGEQAVAPVLTQDAKNLLLNCLTSKEIELWQCLGKNWTISKDEWKGYVPPYVPRFYDGWQPAPTLVEEPVSRPPPNLESVGLAHSEQMRGRTMDQDGRAYAPERVTPFQHEDGDRFHRDRGGFEQFEPDPRAQTPPRNILSNPSVVGYQQFVDQHIERNLRSNERERRSAEPMQPPAQTHQHETPRPINDNTAYLDELRRTGAVAYEVLHDRQGKNEKELTVNKGDIVQVLDSNRNWWKVRNHRGTTGYCPYTILKVVQSDERDQGLSGNMGGEQKGLTRRGFDDAPARHTENRSSTHGQDGYLRTSGRYNKLSESDDVYIPTLSLSDEESERQGHHLKAGSYGIHKTRSQENLHNELRSKISAGPKPLPKTGRTGSSAVEKGGDDFQENASAQSPSTPASPDDSTTGQRPFYITKESSQNEVASWLEMKGFTAHCQRSLEGFNGNDLFSLHRSEMEQLVGREEAARLEGQLTLQKKMTGYKTQSAAQLNAIFHKRRARSDQSDAPLGQEPNYRPSPPHSYDGPGSDSDDDERQLAGTGKTLRDLLIRQRQKIIDTEVFDQQ